jgi:hypothetical protein
LETGLELAVREVRGRGETAFGICRGRSPEGYRNLSEDPLDRRGKTAYYSHCTAMEETGVNPSFRPLPNGRFMAEKRDRLLIKEE